MLDLINRLLTVEADLVVTVTCPYDRRRPGNDEDRIRLRNLVSDARARVLEAPMTVTTRPVSVTPAPVAAVEPPMMPATTRPAGPASAEELVALAVAAGFEDPRVAGDRLFTVAGGSRERLDAACSILIQRLKVRSDDFEATLALRILERSLMQAPYADGPWRWAERLSPRRIRAAQRRRQRVVRRGRAGPST